MSGRFRAGCALALLMVGSAGCASTRRGSAPTGAPAAALPVHAALRQVPLGLCEDYPEETRSLAEVRRDLGVLKAAGIGVLRVSIGWDGLEPARGSYDFAFWDAFVDLAVKEFGIRLVPYVAYTPRWDSDGGADDYWKTPPRDVGAFGEVMHVLAERYRGRIQSWELWNEPDNRDYWLGTPAQYGALLAAGSAAVHAVDPKLAVVFGGLAGGIDFFRTLFDEQNASDVVDIVNLHAYYETWNPNPLETLPSYVDEVAAIVGRHHGQQPIWLAEVGYSDFRTTGGYGTPLRYAYEHTREFQAVMLVRTLALALSKPEVSLFAWYELKDPQSSAPMIGDDHNRHLGVTDERYQPKPAFDALAFGSRLFSAGFRNIDAELRITRTSDSIELHGFVTAHATLVLVAWLPTHPRARAPETAVGGAAQPTPGAAPGSAADARTGSVHLVAPYVTRAAPHLEDERGRPQSGRLDARANGGQTELDFDVRGGEVTVVEVPIAAR